MPTSDTQTGYALDLPAPDEVTRCVHEAAAISHHRAPGRVGFEHAERRDAVLKGHVDAAARYRGARPRARRPRTVGCRIALRARCRRANIRDADTEYAPESCAPTRTEPRSASKPPGTTSTKRPRTVDLLSIARTHRLSADPLIVLYMKVVLAMDAVTSELAPSLNLQAVHERFFSELIIDGFQTASEARSPAGA